MKSRFAHPSRPAWILCRNFDQFPVRDAAVLQEWVERGRVRPDDYLFDPHRDICLQAKELAELQGFFRKAALRRFRGTFWLFALLAKLSCLASSAMVQSSVTARPDSGAFEVSHTAEVRMPTIHSIESGSPDPTNARPKWGSDETTSCFDDADLDSRADRLRV